MTKDFYFSISAGVTVPFAVQSRVNTSNNAAGVLPLVAGAGAAFDSATQDIQTEVETGVAQIRQMTIVLPALTVGLGFML